MVFRWITVKHTQRPTGSCGQATLANDKATFEKFIEPVYLFMNVTPNRVPMSDWVFTDEPNQRGFQARSVVGGYYIKMLEGKLIK